jgi:hypothetical protein
MKGNTLEEFTNKVTAKRRITFGDVRRLQRDLLPDGIPGREEAELLIRLDGQITRVDGIWTDWLVASVVEFAIWGERPTGFVVGEAAKWLSGLLGDTGSLTKAARRIAREIRLEAERIEEPLASLGVAERVAPDVEAHGLAHHSIDTVELMA